MNCGRLIAFEGLDGSGKSTQLRRLAVALRAEGNEVLVTREPTGGEWGRRIRRMARSGERVAPAQELAWFLADRHEHVESTIRPGLDAGRIVLTDRYTLSTVAYQGARGLGPQAVLERCEREFPLPDLALVLELPPRVGLARVEERGGLHEPAFENEEFLERVAEIFRSLRCSYVARIDAAREPQHVEHAIREVVRERLGLLGP